MSSESFSYPIAKSIELISKDPLTVEQRDGKLPFVELVNQRPLVLLFTWLQAKPRYARKYVDLYLDKGLDVLKISTSMWEALWPTFGCQVSASNVLDFLYEHECYQPLMVHGLSCGGYVWSEVQVKAEENMEKYESTLKRVKGQVFDSPPNPPPHFQRGFASALFPNNIFLAKLFEYISRIQLFIFYHITAKHLLKGYNTALDPPVKTPTLVLFSKDDPISNFDVNMGMIESWKKNGVKIYTKCWENSPHVGHLKNHQAEYTALLDSLMDSVGINNLLVRKEVESNDFEKE